MTFDEANQAYAAWRAQFDAGAVTPEQFHQAVGQLRVADAAGVTWQIDPSYGGWLRWDGQQWIPAQTAQPAAPPDAAADAQPARSPWEQRIWDFVSIAGSAALAAIWYWYTSLDAYTGADKRTCIAMLVIPIGLIALRKPIDRALLPLARFKQNIPRMVLLGVGLATPLLVSNFFYHAGSTEYGYMFRTYVFSTLLSYVVLRQPASPSPRPGGL